MSLSIQTITDSLRDMVDRALIDAREDVIRLALEEFEKRARDIIVRAAVVTSNQYSIQKCSNELLIRVRIEGGE